MIIFNFGPFSKDELTIRFDREGAIKFLDAVSVFFDQANDAIAINCLQYTGHVIDVAEMELKREDENRLEIGGGKLMLCMSDEAFEYAKFLLEKFLAEGDFSPAEFYSFSRKNRKYDTQVFFQKFFSVESIISSNGRQ
ncbi:MULTISPECIES: hypothetical protein [Variovorax]|jgi:hypothetical protein|uniref:hypothetical protein n=1 Tax=Variovorax TaxID=34072 RepID=UPI0027890397|nr:hypothetical protein [Variovorax boronicumulans]MDQ0084734.1 hypothetical protein [Variovorax boronicumulans]